LKFVSLFYVRDVKRMNKEVTLKLEIMLFIYRKIIRIESDFNTMFNGFFYGYDNFSIS